MTEDSLTQCISEIRRVLGAAGRELIRTVPRRGYVLLPPSPRPPQVPPPVTTPAPVATSSPVSAPPLAGPFPVEAVPATGEHADTPAKEVGEAERRQVTVLFCDLVGSAALSSRLDPEDLREVLVAYHRRAAEVIERWAGRVANTMGDGVLAYFGHPGAHEDDAERAAQTGLELVDAIGELAQRRDGVGLQLRVGVATGLVVIEGTAGAGGRGAVGETPNRAARLQAAATPGTVVADTATQRRLGGLFECRDLGPVEAKGLPGPVRAWRVLRRAAVSRSGALHASAALAPMVGRETELRLLLHSWAQAKEGEGRVVLLSGEPGIGKSRLAAELADRLAGEPHVVLRYFCSPQHQDSPLFPVVGQLERAAGFDRDDAPEATLGKLTALLARATKQDDEIALIAELTGLAVGDRQPLPDLSPQRRRERLLNALLAQLTGLAAQQPVLMLFEDAHWIDPSSLELLGLTIKRIRRLPVLLVVTSRPEFRPPWAGLPHVTSLALGGLGRREAAALVARTAGSAALHAATVEQIVERTGGVPLFVEELTRAVVEADWHDVAAGQAAPAAGAILPACTVPAALYAPLAARLDRLGGPTREVAQVGAAIGREFAYELLAVVARRPDAELQDALERLVEAGLVFRTGGDPLQATYLFKHTLVRDTAYGTLLRVRRRKLHEAIAHAAAELFPETAAMQPEWLAAHFAEAGAPAKAAEYYLRAASRVMATGGFALTEMVGYVRKGLRQVALLPNAGEARRLRLALQDWLLN